jgi:hypothetical protein
VTAPRARLPQTHRRQQTQRRNTLPCNNDQYTGDDHTVYEKFHAFLLLEVCVAGEHLLTEVHKKSITVLRFRKNPAILACLANTKDGRRGVAPAPPVVPSSGARHQSALFFLRPIWHPQEYPRVTGHASGGSAMTFDEVLAQVLVLLQREGRVSYRALKLRFDITDDYIDG